jgi:hypothetical protein
VLAPLFAFRALLELSRHLVRELRKRDATASKH